MLQLIKKVVKKEQVVVDEAYNAHILAVEYRVYTEGVVGQIGVTRGLKAFEQPANDSR